MKNTVVLKDISSNLIEEAIIVFKENVKIREKQLLKSNSENTKEMNENEKIAIEEAENVILSYIKECEEAKKINKQKTDIRILKVINIFLILMLIIAIIF